MPELSIDFIQLVVIVVMLIVSVLMMAKHLFSGERSMLLLAGQWLYTWCGAVMLLLILEVMDWGVRS